MNARPERRRGRQRLAVALAPLAAILLALGVVLGDESGLVGVLGLVALVQGLGLAVAAVALVLGHNPLGRG